MTLVHRNDPAYPRRLSEIPDAPERLFVRGRLPSSSPAIAIVGARAATGHALARARELARDVARAGALVISGGAIGIDAAAHLGALEAGAPTVVVLATGLDAPYPYRHRPLYDLIVQRGGALVTSFQPGVPLRRWHFPRRNRILAGLADAVVVVEARPGSGSLYTTEAAREYGRVVAACPGSAGAEALLAQGAALVEKAEDVLEAIAGRPRRPAPTAPPPSSDEALILAVLDGRAPCDPLTAARLAGLPAARAARALCALEMEGLALPTPGGQYVRSALAERMF